MHTFRYMLCFRPTHSSSFCFCWVAVATINHRVKWRSTTWVLGQGSFSWAMKWRSRLPCLKFECKENSWLALYDFVFVSVESKATACLQSRPILDGNPGLLKPSTPNVDPSLLSVEPLITLGNNSSSLMHGLRVSDCGLLQLLDA